MRSAVVFVALIIGTASLYSSRRVAIVCRRPRQRTRPAVDGSMSRSDRSCPDLAETRYEMAGLAADSWLSSYVKDPGSRSKTDDSWRSYDARATTQERGCTQ